MRRTLLLVLAGLTLANGAAAQSASPRQAKRSTLPLTQRLLHQELPEIRWDATPFELVMQNLQQLTGINMVVRWEKLENAGVEKENPITIHAKNLRLSQVLWMVMNEAASTDITLAYRMSGNLLILSTAEDLGRELITKVYDVADLMVRVPNVQRPRMDNQQSSFGSQGGGGGGQSIFGGNNQEDDYEQENREPGQATAEMERLIEVIKKTIEPDSWSDVEGEGEITSYGNLLIITNTILVHQKIGGYITE